MKFLNTRTNKKLVCHLCKGEDFTDLEPTSTLSHKVFCLNEKCKDTDGKNEIKTELLVSAKDIKEGIILCSSSTEQI